MLIAAQRDTSVSALCAELGIERVTLYRYVIGTSALMASSGTTESAFSA
jgi:transposase-like protein